MRPVEVQANLSLPLTERHATKKCEGMEVQFLAFLYSELVVSITSIKYIFCLYPSFPVVSVVSFTAFKRQKKR
jgi:hypothetical protein